MLARRGALIALVAVATSAVVLTAMRAPGSEFDEGILLSFPTRIEAGDLPYRDFETFYGPASPYLVAGAFELAGPSLWTERAVGLLFRLALVLGVFLLVRRWGDLVAACCAAVTLLFVGGASEADGGLAAAAFVVLTILLAATGTAAPERRRWWVAAGLAAGVAGLFRPEAAGVSTIAVVPLVWPVLRRAAHFAAGLAIGVVPYVPLAVAAGFDGVRENVDDLRATGQARRLPLPGLTTAGGRALVLVALALLLLVLAYLATRRARGRHVAVLLSLVLVGALQLPYGVWRADEAHFIGAGLVPLAMTPLSVAVLLPSRWRAAALAATALIVASQLLPTELRGDYARNLRITAGLESSPSVSNGVRSFIVEDESAAADIQATIDYLDRRAPAGSRLFVGPRDLRRTNANDAVLYYLLPDLVPASFYLEMDPPFSSASSRLAHDVASSNYLVLSTRWDAWSEPNASAHYGSDTANHVVEARFCRQAVFGTYSIWRRCARGAASLSS